MIPVQNVTGWNELINGQVVAAVFTAFDTPIGGGGYMLLGLFIVLSAVLVIKTNIEIAFIVGIIFLGVFGTTPWINNWAKYFIIGILIVEFGVILFKTFFKNG
jgi:hypothetical protein